MNLTPERLMNVACTITPDTGDGSPDEYNDPTPNPGTPVETTCWHHQGVGQLTGRYALEETGLVNIESDQHTFYFPPGTVVDASSTVEVDAGVFEIVGPPWDVVHPRTTEVEFVVATARMTD